MNQCRILTGVGELNPYWRPSMNQCRSLTGVGLLYSLIPLLIFPRQEGCGRNGVFARNLCHPFCAYIWLQKYRCKCSANAVILPHPAFCSMYYSYDRPVSMGSWRQKLLRDRTLTAGNVYSPTNSQGRLVSMTPKLCMYVCNIM